MKHIFSVTQINSYIHRIFESDYAPVSYTHLYGVSIPKTSQEVQDKVKSAIETMTGLTVSEVNIRIAGIQMDYE